MHIKTIFCFCVIAVMGITSCRTKQAPESGDKGPVSLYTPDMPNDSSVVRPTVDPNAVEGINIVKYKNGIIKAKGYCTDGKKTGEWQSFFENGKMWSDEYFTNGYPDGAISVWYDNGQMRYKGQYRNGKPVGKWQYWGQDGALKRTADYDKKGTNTAM